MQIAQVYREQKEKISKNVEALRQGLGKLAAPELGKGLTPAMLDEGAMMALRLADPIVAATARAEVSAAGFLPHALARLPPHARAMFRSRRPHAGRACKGGIYDHLGGGFARYSTDVDWLVPHFEKMLYDNALLIELMTEVGGKLGAPL